MVDIIRACRLVRRRVPGERQAISRHAPCSAKNANSAALAASGYVTAKPWPASAVALQLIVRMALLMAVTALTLEEIRPVTLKFAAIRRLSRCSAGLPNVCC